MTIAQILKLAKLYGDHCGLAPATVSTYAANDGKLFKKLAEGRASCTLKRVERLVQWFSENWPEDLEWPADAPRPAPSNQSPQEKEAC